MKWKIRITSIILGLLVIYMIASGLFTLTDIISLYLFVLIPTVIVISIEYFIRRKIRFKDFLKAKVFGHLFTILFCFGFLVYYMQDKPISKQTAINDLNYMIESLEHIHPDIYHLIPKDSFLIEYNNEINNLPEKVSELEFFKVCARLTSHFRTGHTRPMENLLASKSMFRRTFPYKTKIIDDRLFVTTNLSLLSSVPLGSEIIEINNKGIKQVIDEWSNLVSYENEAFRNYLITKPVNISIWNNFKPFKIKYVEYNSKEIIEKTVNGSVASNMFHFFKSKFQKPQKLFYRELTPETGYIGFFSCMDLKNYESFYKTTFSKLKNKGIEHLIIDIRDNGGGYSIITAWLEQYIFNQPHNDIDSAIVKVSNELIATGKVKKKLPYIKDAKARESYTRIPGLRQLKELPLRYKGKTYLLTNNGTFSAAQGFASAYKCYGQGTIIGEETGGATVNFGDVHIFKLPDTGLKIMTSWEQAFSACGTDNQRGVIPDFTVRNSIEDDINHKDRVLEFTLKLINDKK
ncbi:S41 family peptidase [Saccharicrinis sp. FJH62]|uniref:S41 family peptidase n=1 Tax=Saccharicrinis sp. FJH62 TaxID=3344657 RepID=UPI0035D52276